MKNTLQQTKWIKLGPEIVNWGKCALPGLLDQSAGVSGLGEFVRDYFLDGGCVSDEQEIVLKKYFSLDELSYLILKHPIDGVKSLILSGHGPKESAVVLEGVFESGSIWDTELKSIRKYYEHYHSQLQRLDALGLIDYEKVIFYGW